MNRKTLFSALACALLVFSMVGCGTTNKLQSVTLTAALINGIAPSSQSGFVTLQGNGGTITLQATGIYTGSGSKDLTNRVTYSVVVDPQYNQDAFGNTLLPPCATPCQTAGQGTVEYSTTGLITAVEPATCTWVDIAPLPATTPAWFYVGDYLVTATYQGVTSQPMFIPIASSAGDQYYPYNDIDSANENNPDGLCGPSSGQ